MSEEARGEAVRGECVLIVDDIAENLDLLGSLLAEEGYTVLAASGGEQAIKAARARHPDLVLLDIVMPGMDGFEVCRRLKADEGTATIPVIFLTARTEPDNLVRGFEAGGADYVAKPFQRAELLARVRTHLGLSRSRRRVAELTRESERRRIALDLHDTLAQELAASLMHAQLLAGGQSASSAPLLDSLRSAIADVRQIAWDLRPPALDHDGLAAALEQYSRAFGEKQGIEVEVSIEGMSDFRLSSDASVNLFRIFQESLSNASRHSGARKIWVELRIGPSSARLCVADDGKGMGGELPKAKGEVLHLGIEGMRERAKLLRGRLELLPRPGGGTKVLVEVPIGG